MCFLSTIHMQTNASKSNMWFRLGETGIKPSTIQMSRWCSTSRAPAIVLRDKWISEKNRNWNSWDELVYFKNQIVLSDSQLSILGNMSPYKEEVYKYHIFYLSAKHRVMQIALKKINWGGRVGFLWMPWEDFSFKVMRRGHHKSNQTRSYIFFPSSFLISRGQKYRSGLSTVVILIDIEGQILLTSTVRISIVAWRTFITLPSPIIGETNTLTIWTAHAVGHAGPITETCWRNKIIKQKFILFL